MAKRAVGRTDNYPNRALQTVTQSAADTLTFSQMRFGMGVFTGNALIVHRLDFYPTEATIELLQGTADNLQMAITNRDDLTSLDPDNMNCLALKEVQLDAFGTPANMAVVELPLQLDFSNLPGMGLIIPANPLFMAVDSASLGTAGIVDMVMYYTIKTLTDADYVELVQSLIPVNI